MKNLSDLKILVIGDIMLDKYVIGDVDRISPEAPVPVVDVKREYCTLGGCGNVAKNLSNLNVSTTCIAACGTGPGCDRVASIMKRKDLYPGLVRCRDRVTTVKERIISQDRNTQLLRIDRETREPVEDHKIITELKHNIWTKMFIPNIILISDYNKGVITPGLMYQVQDIATKINAKLIIDPKPSNKECYNSAFAITPNHKEFEQMREIVNSDFFKNIIVTRGSEGVFIPKAEKFGPVSIDAEEVEVYNVTGAGDSFVAIFSICIGMDIDVVQSTRIANKCAAYVVTKPGTTAVPVDIFKKSVRSIIPKETFI
jgi:rfaE bifunctional protein kinase chain/domain